MKSKYLLLTLIAIIGFSKVSNAQVPSYVPASGLKAWWGFNGNAKDESGNGIDGVIDGATLTSDRNAKSGAAFSFDGNDQIICGKADSLNVNECTFSAWIYITKSPQYDYQTIFAKYDRDSFGSYALSIAGDRADIWFTSSSIKPFEMKSNNFLSINEWHHIVVTHSLKYGTTLYLDGQVDNSDSSIFNVLQAPNDLFRIGQQGPFFPAPMDNGKIDEIGIWNRALTQKEISNLYHGTIAGMSDISKNNLLTFYPNPASEFISLLSAEQLIGSAYTIFDCKGNEVLKGIINTVNSDIPVNNLSNGVYLLNVNGNINHKFVVSKSY